MSEIVSICGIPPTNSNKLASFLSSSGIRVVTWAPNISKLICGDGSASHWKLDAAQRLGIPVVRAEDLFAAGRARGELWVTRYAPKKLRDIIGAATPITELSAWLKGWDAGVAGGGVRGALVTGPPGIGKTTAVGLIVAACGYDLVEFNASDERSATAVRRYFDEAKRSGFVGRRRVIVMDEVDGMSTGDRGGIGELAKVIAVTTFPIICIANERGTPRLRPLNSCCLDVRFTRPTKSVIAKALHSRVVIPEKLNYTVAQLEELCEKNGNDIRSIVNALQFSSITLADGAKDELQRVDAFSATGRLIGGSDPLAVKEQLVYLDYGMVPLMVAEAYIASAKRPRDKCADNTALLKRCRKSGDYLGDYDILDRRIHSSQAWNLMPYAASAVVSAAVTTEGIAPFQIFPSLLGKQSKRSKHRRWIRDMRSRGVLGGNAEEMLDTMDSLRSMLFMKGKSVGDIVGQLTDLGATRDDMLETIVEMTYKDDAGRIALDTKTKSAITREWKKIEGKAVVVKVKPEMSGDGEGDDAGEDDVDLVDSDDDVGLDLLD